MRKEVIDMDYDSTARIGHKILARHSFVDAKDRLSIPLIKRAILATLRLQGVTLPCEISVLVTDERTIRELNREFRGVDASTDVLSFPMQELTPMQSLTLSGWEIGNAGKQDPETGLMPLGEIVISARQVSAQASEYGHSRQRETAYLVIHSVLHLLGYDHEDEGDDKKRMRESEKAVMEELSIFD